MSRKAFARLKYATLALIIFSAFTFIVFTNIPVEASPAYIIDGNRVYFEDSKVFLQSEPKIFYEPSWVNFDLIPKQYTGDIDVVWLVDTTVMRPRIAEFYKPHQVNTTYSYTCNGDYFNYTYVAKSHADNHFWCWNNVTDYESNVTTGWHYELVEDNWFEWGNIPSSIAYWNVSRIENYVDVSNRLTSVDVDYGGMNKAWYATDLPVVAGNSYQVRVFMDVQYGKHGNNKYWFCTKPSSETISEAISSGHLYCLDPWWNVTYNYNKTIQFTNSTFLQAGYPVVVNNFTCDNHCQANGEDLRVVNSTGNEISFGLQVTSSNNFNLTFKINAESDNTTNITVYYGNENASFRNVSWNEARNNIWEDFEDNNNGRYTIGHGNWSVSQTQVLFGTYSMAIQEASTSDDKELFIGNATNPIQNFTMPIKIEVYRYEISHAGSDGYSGICLIENDGTAGGDHGCRGYKLITGTSDNSLKIFEDTGSTIVHGLDTGTSITNYQWIKMEWNYSVATGVIGGSIFHTNGDLIASGTVTDTTLSPQRITLHDYRSSAYFDNLKVRMVADTEPTIIIGAEQTIEGEEPYIIVTFNHSAVAFGLLDAESNDNLPTLNFTHGAYNVSIDTNNNYKIESNASNFTDGGSHSFDISNLKIDMNSTAVDIDLSDAIQLSESLQTINTGILSSVLDNYYGYWLSIPNVFATSYTAGITITYSSV